MLIPESERAAWEAVPEEMLPRNTARTCYNCAHDGQCVDLPYCGGRCWEPQEQDEDESWEALQEAERERRENALDAIKEGDAE